MKEKTIFKCPDHMEYKAIKPPKRCKDCWLMFLSKRNIVLEEQIKEIREDVRKLKWFPFD